MSHKRRQQDKARARNVVARDAWESTKAGPMVDRKRRDKRGHRKHKGGWDDV